MEHPGAKTSSLATQPRSEQVPLAATRIVSVWVVATSERSQFQLNLQTHSTSSGFFVVSPWESSTFPAIFGSGKSHMS